MELVMIRHGEPVRIEASEGRADPPLSPRGWEQAHRLATWLAEEDIHQVWGSPLVRAVETAAPLCETLGVPLRADDRLAEYDRDASSYIPVEELRELKDERWQAMVEGRMATGAAEVDHRTFVADIVAAVDEIVGANPGSRRVAVVCHGGVINCYVGHLLGIDRALWFEPRYTSISRVLASRSGIRTVGSLNETAHLRGTDLLAPRA
jgi:broad specificity phosphatase PhoE